MKLPFHNERLPVKQILVYGFIPSFLKKFIYKIKGYKIGPNVSIGFGSIIIGKKVIIKKNVHIGFLSVIRANQIEIDEYSSIASLCYIDTNRLKIGKDSRIREQVKIGGLKTPDSELIIGDRCLINHSVFLNPTLPITIGNDTAIGGRSLLFTHNSWLSQLEGYPVKFGPIKIGNKVWISWQTFIMAGVEIGDCTLIQPNAVISRDIPENSIFISQLNRVVPNTVCISSINFERKLQIVKQILSDFSAYLEYQGFKVSKENGMFFCKINRTLYTLILDEADNIELPSKYNNILLTFKKINISPNKINGVNMVLSFDGKTRLGTNLLGEELVKFFSRYGIRFQRIDKIYH